MPRLDQELCEWTDTGSRKPTNLSTTQAGVFALYSFGMVLVQGCGLTSIAVFLGMLLGRKENSVRQQLRELTYEGADKRGTKRQTLEVEACFGGLLSWVLSGWDSSDQRLALAIDATNSKDIFTVLTVSVVYRGCAIPVAWRVLGATTESAAQHSSQFSDGVYLVELAPLSSPEHIVAAVADAIGVQFAPGNEPRQQLLNAFHGRKMLLVMDNFEHLLDGAEIVTDILRTAPIKIITTSRERLNLSGETVFLLSGMDFPDWETPDDALNYGAVKLFMQSALRAKPDFTLAADDLTLLARICRQVAGMPLGIVLTAAWVSLLSLNEIADEIARRLDFLETDMHDIPKRQRSIRRVLQYSYLSLTADEQRVYRNGPCRHDGIPPREKPDSKD